MIIDPQAQSLLTAIKIDQVCTIHTARVQYGCDHECLNDLERAGKIHCVERNYKISNGSRRLVPIKFVCRDARTTKRPNDTLRHLAGLGEMRHRLGSPLRWHLSMLTNPQLQLANTELPDAIWFSDGFPPAVIEFDAGSQPHREIARKTSVYHQKSWTQIWGAPTARRAQNILHILERHAPDPLGRWVGLIDFCPP